MPGSTTDHVEPIGVIEPSPTAETEAKQRKRAQDAHRSATQSFSKVVSQLVDLVGAPLTAYLGSVGETRAVREWINRERVPHPTTQSKLQLALQIAQELADEGEEGAIEAWFQGLNPALDDRPPAELIRNATKTDLSKVGKELLIAAREFANS